METKATVILEVNGKQAVNEMDVIQSKLREICCLLDDAKSRNDNLSVKKYEQEIRILEKRLAELKLKAEDVNAVMSELSAASPLKEYSRITNIEIAKAFVARRNSFMKNLHGLTVYQLGEEIERLLTLRNNIDFKDGKEFDFMMPNGFKFTLTSSADLDSLITPVRDKGKLIIY